MNPNILYGRNRGLIYGRVSDTFYRRAHMYDFRYAKLIKVLISLCAGWACFGLSRFPVAVDPAYDLNIPWSLIFPVVISTAWGFRYSLITCLPGLAIFAPVLMRPDYGWAGFSGVLFLFIWLMGTGFVSDMKKANKKYFYVIYIFQAAFIIVYLTFNRGLTQGLAGLNPPFWYKGYTFSFLPENIIHVNEIVTAEFLTVIIFAANSVFELGFVKRIFGIKEDIKVSRLIGLIVGITFSMYAVFAVLVINGVFSSYFSFVLNSFQQSVTMARLLLLICLLVALFGDISVQMFNYVFTMQKKEERKITELNEQLESRVQSRTKDLQSAYEELESFSYTVSHELKSPVHGIKLYNDIIREDDWDKLSDDGKESVESIDKYCENMSGLINGVMKYSKVSSAVFMIEAVDMKKLVLEVWDELTKKGAEKKHEINIQPDLPGINADRFMMHQAVFNVLANAIKFSGTRDVIKADVWGEKHDGVMEYHFKDYGVGFDMKYASDVFELFNRMHTDEEFEGHGIGLAIIQNVMKKHRGYARIYAEPDKGCEVVLGVPEGLSN